MNNKDRQVLAKEDKDKDFLHIIIEHLPVAVFVKSAEERRFILWNKASESLFGIASENALGKTDYDLFPKEQADFFWKKDTETFEKHSIEDIPEEPIDNHVTGRRILHTKKIPVYDEKGNPLYLLGISKDITDLKDAEKTSRESEERYRTAIEHSNDGIAITKGSKHIYVNRKFREIFGYDSSDETESMFFSKIVHPDDLERVQKYAMMRQRKEAAPSRYEFKGIKQDGAICHIEVSVTTIILKEEQFNLAYLRDITERKESEESERRRTQQLAKMVHELQMFNRLTVDRELRMIELKKQINNLRLRLGEGPLFNTDELGSEPAKRAIPTERS